MRGIIYKINVKSNIEGERGIPKYSVDSARFSAEGVEGDYNHYRTESKNRTPDRAVLIIPLETLDDLNKEGWPVKPGDLGENVTSKGVPYDFFEVGSKYCLGDAVIEVREHATPCKILQLLPYVSSEKKAEFVKTLVGRRGLYCALIKEGIVKEGDSIIKV
ncbi:MOSC domain-containing protein [archaeon]|nr:MOSC domain-containing protein [archaeon]